MAESKESIKNKIKRKIGNNSGTPGWYIGITDDPERRLEEHNVSPQNQQGSYEAYTENVAREIEEEFLAQKPYPPDGGRGGGRGGDTKYVYVYHKSDKTIP